MMSARMSVAVGLVIALVWIASPSPARGQGPVVGGGYGPGQALFYAGGGLSYAPYVGPTQIHPWLRRHGVTRTPPDAEPSYAGGYGYEYNNIPPRFELRPTPVPTTANYMGGYGYQYNNTPGGFGRVRLGRGGWQR